MARKAKGLKDFQSGTALTQEAETIRKDLSESPPCVRCNHGAEDHLGGECDQDGCDCVTFVYPSDPEAGPITDPLGNQRLLDDNPTRSAAINTLYPLMQSAKLAKDTFQRASATLVEAQKLLKDAMDRHGCKKFEYGGLECEITSKEKVGIHETGEGTLPGIV